MLVLHINTYSMRVECWYYTLILIVRGWSVGIIIQGGVFITLILIVRGWSITH